MKKEDYTLLEQAEAQGGLKKYKTYLKFSGPGWIQGAVTLGGGSLAGSLFLGIIGGAHFMWLQPLAMLLGIVMLSTISYITLSTQQRPFQTIKEHISPSLAWGWVIATLMANVIWAMPQFNLAQAAIKQNLFNLEDSSLTTFLICTILFVLALAINYIYDSGNKGIKYVENTLKVIIAVIILSFIAVVFVLLNEGDINFVNILKGFIPDFGSLTTVSDTLQPFVNATGEANTWWSNHIIDLQRNRIISAFGTAVGINMTFMLPYSFLRKKWDKRQRGLAVFDLSIGLVIPFVVATSCIMITAASQFHTKTADVLAKNGKVFPHMKNAYHKIVDKRLKASLGETMFNDIKGNELDYLRQQLPKSEKQLSAMLANRDNFNLANTLAPLTGNFWAQIVFGLGVLGMAFSTLTTLMMINGFTLCELLNKPNDKKLFRIGCIISGVGGMIGPFIWSGDAKAALAIPTSVIGTALLPLAYLSFLLLMNSKKVMKDDILTGKKRFIWNILMVLATFAAFFASIWGLQGNLSSSNSFLAFISGVGFIALVVLSIVGCINFYKRNIKS